MTSWIKRADWRARALPTSPLKGGGCVWANREWVLLQPLTVGGISGWWVHEWSLAVTAADGWRNPSGQRVFSSSRELNTDRRRHLACTYTHAEHWELLFKQDSDIDGAKSSKKWIALIPNYKSFSPNTCGKQVCSSSLVSGYSTAAIFSSLKTNWISRAPTLICTQSLCPRVHRQGASSKTSTLNSLKRHSWDLTPPTKRTLPNYKSRVVKSPLKQELIAAREGWRKP